MQVLREQEKAVFGEVAARRDVATLASRQADRTATGVLIQRNLIVAGCLALGAVLFFVMLDSLWGISPIRNSGYSYFALQADAWLHGRWNLSLPHLMVDLITLHGQYYSVFGPFPALLMLPLVAVFGPSVSDILFTLVISALNLGLLFLLFEQMRACGLTQRGWRENVVWSVLLYLGGTAFSLSLGGGVWYEGHIVACACLLVSLLLAFRRQYIWSAVALTCGFFSRSTLIFGFVFLFYLAWQDGATGPLLPQFVRSLWQRTPDWTAVPWRRLAGVAGVLVGCLVLYAVRNWGMFGNPLESGYGIQLVQRYPMVMHGVLNIRYIPANLINDFFNFPHIVFPGHYSNLPRIDLDNGYTGLCVFLTTPLFIYLFARNRHRSLLRTALWGTLLLGMAFVLLYYTAGFHQVGTRYLFDLYPFAWLLLILSDVKLDWRVVALGVFAIVLNMAGSYQYWTNLDYFSLPHLNSIVYLPHLPHLPHVASLSHVRSLLYQPRV